MRTQGILLVRDTILLLSIPIDGELYLSPLSWFQLRFNSLVPGTKLGPWRQSCDRLLPSLEELSQTLFDNTRSFRELGDESGADLIGSSCIACLAHLAILCEVICRLDPAAEEMYNLCDSALLRLGTLSSELQSNEYTYLDLLLGVRPSLCCLQKAMA